MNCNIRDNPRRSRFAKPVRPDNESGDELTGSSRLIQSSRMSVHRRLVLQFAAGLAARGLLGQSTQKLRLGIVIGISADPDAAIRRVHELGFSTCQVSPRDTDDATAAKLRQALDRYEVEASAAIAGGPGPEVYNFYQGPQTIGLVPRATDRKSVV